jgi:tetratricopeptide (TPR) repeat protein
MDHSCPLYSVERRLSDGLILWNKAKAGYFSPDEFRINLNSTIQTLRSVTFVLQKLKGDLAGFEEWYSPWQDKMRSDHLMRWLVESRNIIEKQGDLETYSRAKISLIESWFEPPSREFDVPPFAETDNYDVLISKVLPEDIDSSIGLLKIERRWVDSRMSDEEILTVLAHGFGVLSQLLYEAHIHFIEGPSSECSCEFMKTSRSMKGRIPPCMLGSGWDRTQWMNAKDGSIVVPQSTSIPVSMEGIKAAKQRYGYIGTVDSPVKGARDLKGRIGGFMEMAKAILARDGYHDPIALLGFADGRLAIIKLVMNDRVDKHFVIRQLAADIERHGATWVILINEAWYSTNAVRYAAEDPERGECLQLIGANPEGEEVCYTIPFTRSDAGEIVFDEELLGVNKIHLIQPIRDVWSRGGKISQSGKSKNPLSERRRVVGKAPAKCFAEYHEPGRNDRCVCGSGIKFKKCCLGQYSSQSEDFWSACNAGDYGEALIHARRHLTWYVLSHRAHTEPLIESGSEVAEDWLLLDINVLSELLDHLFFCYVHTGIEDTFIDVFDVAQDYVLDPRWGAKIAYFRGLWFLRVKKDDVLAREQLQSINLSKCNDPEYLGLYIQLNNSTLSFNERIELADRIIAHSNIESTKLHYRMFKSVQHLLIEERSDALSIIREAVSEYEKVSPDKRSVFGQMTYAFSLQLYAQIGSLSEIYEKAISVIDSLVADGLGDSDLYRLQGDCYFDIGKVADAKTSYAESGLEVSKVFLAECYMIESDLESARRTLDGLDDSVLSKYELFDFAISWAKLALYSLKVADKKKALDLLSVVEAESPYFKAYRDNLKIDLLQLSPQSPKGVIQSVLLSLNKYITLKPNFFGVGIDVNQIIEDKFLSQPDDPADL